MFYSDINQQDPLVDRKLVDLEAIYQSIDNIIGTEKGERMFLPTFGVDLLQYVYEPLTRATEFAMLTEIAEAIRIWEPRVTVLFQKSYVKSFPDTHDSEVFIVFKIKGQTDEEYVYQTTLNRNQKGQYYAV